MEKILYPVWKPAAIDGDTFRDMLLAELAPELVALGVRGLRVSVVDSDVAAAAGLRQAMRDTYTANMAASISPGSSAPTNMSPTLSPPS